MGWVCYTHVPPPVNTKLGVILYVQWYVCILSFALKAQSVIQSFDYEKHKILSWYNSN